VGKRQAALETTSVENTSSARAAERSIGRSPFRRCGIGLFRGLRVMPTTRGRALSGGLSCARLGVLGSEAVIRRAPAFGWVVAEGARAK